MLLRFRLRQLYVRSLEKFFVPLPKLSEDQAEVLAANLRGRGFVVRSERPKGRQLATKGGLRISVDGELGLARTGHDLLDAIAPAIPEMLAAGGPGEDRSRLARRYFSISTSGAKTILRFFPRMESVRTWTALRRDGLCGLTPDEAEVLDQVLGRARAGAEVECVTARPIDGSRLLQVGRRQYYSAILSVAEFLSSLGTIESEDLRTASFLPRGSTLVLRGLGAPGRLSPEGLGEWWSGNLPFGNL